MSNMFDIDFDNDSAEEKEVVTQMSQSILANNSAFKQSQSVVLNSDKKQNDKYIPNQISKNILFYQVEDDLIHLGEEEKSEKNQNILESPKKQTSEKKTIRRKKVDTKIKLQPLKTLDLVKKTQAISLITSPVLKKTQSLQPSYQPKQFQQSNLDLTSVQKEKVLNFQMGDSSQEEQNSDSINNFKTPTKKENQNPHKLNLELSANVFFQDSDYQKNSDDNKEDQQNEQNRPNKNNKSLEKKRSTKKNDLQESEQKQQTISQCGQNEKDDSDSENAKVGIQQEPNPQISKKYINQPNNEITQQQYLNTINGQKSQQKSQFDNLKSLLLDTLMKNSVLNLKLRRKQSLLNFFSPQFRIEFLQDKYFIMNSKKTSSKPSSTFIFSGSEINYDQTSRRFLGKMKSNIGGSVYNIYGPGLNPSDAKDKNLPPRQLLATVFYKTQFMGTSRPKQLIVYAKKPQYLYYRDFRGVRMYDEEIPLNKLYNFYPENKQKIHVFKTRRPHFHPEKRQYVMNFEGKVKISSVKNFILEDRSNGNQKVLLFGKITQNDFILDIHSPLTPIVGIGVALTMFDSRMGSE